jgi:uncharacterized Zn finger protein
MALAKRIFGVVGIVFGAVGILLAIISIVAVWAVNKPITDSVHDLLDTADAALVTVDNVLVRADSGLQEARGFVSDVAEAIPGTELAGRIDNLLGLVEAAATAADSANTVVGLTNKVSNLWRDDDPNAPETTIEKLSTTLDDLATRLAEIDQKAKDLQERNVVGEIAAQIDGEIAGVQDGLNEVSSSVDEAQTTVADLHVAIPRWIDIASIILTFLLIWMGVAQFALAAYGWKWFQVTPPDKEIEPAPALIVEGEAAESPSEEPAAEALTEKVDDADETAQKESVEEASEEVDTTKILGEIQEYQDEAEKLIKARGRDNYTAAAGSLVQAKALYEDLGQVDEWKAYIAALKERNSRLRALMEELEKAGL